MGALTVSWLHDFESNMRQIQENEYLRLASNLWWPRFMRTVPSKSRRELVSWLLTTAKIEDVGSAGGQMIFEDLVQKYAEFENSNAVAGLKLKRQQMEDLDGGGVDLATKWAGDIGAYMAYWPQKQLTKLIKEGHLATSLTYDGKPFFATDHPLIPGEAGSGAYSNLLTDHPIDDSVSVEEALTNLSRVIAHVRAIKMPNGEDPRFLRPVAILAPPRMQARVVQLTNAKFIAQAAKEAGAGGSSDVEALIASFGFTQPIVADELAGFESDTTWFLACEELASSRLGSFVYIDREPFRVTYYTGQGGGTGVDAELDRKDELEWHCKGRNKAGYGHPYGFFKCTP